MIATNNTAPISASLRAQVQKLRGDALSKQEFEGLDADVVGSLIDILDQAENVLTVLEDEEERVQANADLSNAGRVKAMTRAVRAASDKLRLIGQKGADRRQAFNAESAEIYAAPKPSSDSLVNAIRESDLRRQLQWAPLHAQMRAYQTAVENSWASTIRVLKDTEVFGGDQPLMAFIQRVDQERFEQKEPKKAARLKALQYSAETLQALSLGIEFRLSTYGEEPTFKTLPIGKMNLGFQNPQQDPAKNAAVDQSPAGVSSFQ